MKGKLHPPNEQGNIEQGNADIKKASQNWIAKYTEEKWPLIGINRVNAQM